MDQDAFPRSCFWLDDDHVSGPGAADRLGLDPGQPGGTGQAVTVTAVAAGPVTARVLAAAAAASLSAGYR